MYYYRVIGTHINGRDEQQVIDSSVIGWDEYTTTRAPKLLGEMNIYDYKSPSHKPYFSLADSHACVWHKGQSIVQSLYCQFSFRAIASEYRTGRNRDVIRQWRYNLARIQSRIILVVTSIFFHLGTSCLDKNAELFSQSSMHVNT